MKVKEKDMDEERKDTILDQFTAWLDEDNIANVVYCKVEEKNPPATLEKMQNCWYRCFDDLFRFVGDRVE